MQRLSEMRRVSVGVYIICESTRPRCPFLLIVRFALFEERSADDNFPDVDVTWEQGNLDSNPAVTAFSLKEGGEERDCLFVHGSFDHVAGFIKISREREDAL